MLRKNDKIGEYILIKRLGQGGFGEVWKAEKRTELSTNEFAIKFFVPKDESKIDRDKIRKEIETWKILSGYSHIITVIEADIFEQYVYVVSELAEGGALDKYLIRNDGKAKDHAEAVKIASDILIGLEQMHGEGFVHRDLKPANILIKKGLHCLADFGISREMKTSSKATATSGTWEYMPPEALEAKPSVTLHTDIWGTGIILHQLLTGKLPYPQEFPSVVSAILFHPPELDIENLPPEFLRIITKALQRKREDRYQTAREMRVELEKALKKSPKDTIIEENYEQDIAEIRQAEAEKARLARELKEAKEQTEEVRRELNAEKAKQAEIERRQQKEIAEEEDRRQAAIKLERERTERETLAEKERQRIADEEKVRQEKLKKEREEQEKRDKLLQRLRAVNARAEKVGIYKLGEAGLSEPKLFEFENQIVAAERKAQEVEAERQREIERPKQAELLQRVKVANEKAARLEVEKLGLEYLNEESVSRFEKYVAEKETEAKRKAKRKAEATALWVIVMIIVGLPIAVIIGTSSFWSPVTNANKSAPTTTTVANKAAPVSSNPNTFKNSIGMEFVKIPAGSFDMGSNESNDEKPIHRVTISKEFYMGKYEVTQEEWKALMGSLPTKCDAGSLSGEFVGERKPIICVSWKDAQDFVRTLNAKGEGKYRLPSEAEWEYAARAKSTTKYSYGDGEGLLGDYAWYSENAGSKTHEVGTKKANEFGLYDMHGNVWEWCNDWYGDYASGAVTDPSGAQSGSDRVDRGGGWGITAGLLRSAYRGSNTPSDRDSDVGFRLLREI